MIKNLLIILFIIINTIFLTIAVLSYMFFWYETFNLSASSFKEYKANLIIKGIIDSFISLWLITIIYPFNLFIPTTIKVNKENNSNNLSNIILIHGLFHNKTAWLFILYKLLRYKKINYIYIIKYNSYYCSFEDIYQQLEKQIRYFVEKQNNKIILIGHSLGGLFCYKLCKDKRIANHIDSIITLGTPYQGSKLAAFGISKLARELKYKGELILNLKKDNILPHIKGFVFYSPIDNLVLPNTSLKSPERSWKEIITNPISHVKILYNNNIATQIINIIANS